MSSEPLPHRPAPPPTPLHPVSPRRHGAGRPVPLPPVPLLGRERELTEARTALRRDEVRLLTLVGTGGTGKTHLALQVAFDLSAGSAFADGVRFIPLATVADAALAPTAIAHALDLAETGGRSATDLLRAALRDRHMLLVLDNLEQIITVGAWLVDLLIDCPGLNVLATSRTPLHVRGEHQLAIGPLPVPDDARPPLAAALCDYAAVALFVDRARAVDPHFTLTDANAGTVAAVCRHLDGLPLAIELAAARVATFSPGAILARLDRRLPFLHGHRPDAPSRHQTMRAAIAWSYALLRPDEQALFRHLAAFPGGAPLDFIEGGPRAEGRGPRTFLTGSGISPEVEPDETDSALGPRPSALDALASLVDASLLQSEPVSTGESRVRMLETIREFATEQLEASGEADAVRRHHAALFLALAEEAERHLHGPRQGEWIARLAREEANLRAALAWAEGNAATSPVGPDRAGPDRGGPDRGGPDRSLGLRLAGALWLYWVKHGQVEEGRGWLERALAGSPDAPPEGRAKALMGAGALAGWNGDLDRAASRFGAALALWRQLGQRRESGRALSQLGAVALNQGDHHRAVTLLDEALALHRATGDAPYAALAQTRLGWCLFQLGERARGLALCEAGLHGQREIGEHWALSLAQITLADLVLADGDPGQAASLFHEVLTASHHGDVVLKLSALVGLTCVADAMGQAEHTALLGGAADVVHATGGVMPQYGVYTHFGRAIAHARSLLGEAAFTAAWTKGRTLTAQQLLAVAAAVRSLPSNPPPVPRPAPDARPTPRDDEGHVHEPGSKLDRLSPREREVLRLIAADLTNQQIADRLGISRRTVTTHATNILAKLNLDSRTAAVAYALRHGFA